MNFSEINLVPPLKKALEKLDFKIATEIQKQAIPILLK